MRSFQRADIINGSGIFKRLEVENEKNRKVLRGLLVLCCVYIDRTTKHNKHSLKT